MKKLMQSLWNDEQGFVVSSELVLIGTVLILGLIVGLETVRNGIVQELGDVALAFGAINQDYAYSAITGHASSVAGSAFNDLLDDCDGPDNPAQEPACISIQAAAGLPEGP